MDIQTTFEQDRWTIILLPEGDRLISSYFDNEFITRESALVFIRNYDWYQAGKDFPPHQISPFQSWCSAPQQYSFALVESCLLEVVQLK